MEGTIPYIVQGTWGEQGAYQPLGGSNVSGLTEEAGRAIGDVFLTYRRIGARGGDTRCEIMGRTPQVGAACVFIFQGFFSNIPPTTPML